MFEWLYRQAHEAVAVTSHSSVQGKMQHLEQLIWTDIFALYSWLHVLHVF